jgi:hypothetical protein
MVVAIEVDAPWAALADRLNATAVLDSTRDSGSVALANLTPGA